jgi:hypothetical protein
MAKFKDGYASISMAESCEVAQVEHKAAADQARAQALAIRVARAREAAEKGADRERARKDREEGTLRIGSKHNKTGSTKRKERRAKEKEVPSDTNKM